MRGFFAILELIFVFVQEKNRQELEPREAPARILHLFTVAARLAPLVSTDAQGMQTNMRIACCGIAAMTFTAIRT